MKQYNMDHIEGLFEEPGGEWVKYSDAEGIINKLKGWHGKALRMQAKMAEDIEPLYNKIEDLEEQNKEMLEEMHSVVDCEFTPDGIKVRPNTVQFLRYLIEKIEKEKDK